MHDAASETPPPSGTASSSTPTSGYASVATPLTILASLPPLRRRSFTSDSGEAPTSPPKRTTSVAARAANAPHPRRSFVVSPERIIRPPSPPADAEALRALGLEGGERGVDHHAQGGTRTSVMPRRSTLTRASSSSSVASKRSRLTAKASRPTRGPRPRLRASTISCLHRGLIIPPSRPSRSAPRGAPLSLHDPGP